METAPGKLIPLLVVLLVIQLCGPQMTKEIDLCSSEFKTLKLALKDLLRERYNLNHIYLVCDDIYCQPDFENVSSDQGITFEAYGVSEFDHLEFKVPFSTSNLLVMYINSNSFHSAVIKESILSYFVNILVVSPNTHFISSKVYQQIDYEVLLLHYFNKQKAVLRNHHSGQEEIVGVWSLYRGWRLIKKEKVRSLTLKGKQLKVATLPALQFNQRQEINGTVVYSGLYISYLQLLAESIDFTYTIVEPEDMVYGSDFDGDGHWNGIIGMAQRGEIDIGSAPFTQTVERRKAIDYLEYFTHSGLGMLMRKPNNSMQYHFLAAFKPFKLELWIAFASSILLSSLTLWILLYLEQHATITSNFDKYHTLTLFKDCWRYFLGASFGQGGVIPSYYSSLCRMLVSCVWITIIILHTTYMANLISYIAVPKAVLPANTLKELAEQNTHKIGVVKSSSHEILFRTATSGYFKKIWGKMHSDPNNIVPFVQALSKVKNEKFIFILEEILIDFLLKTDCSLVRGKESFLPRYLGLITPKNWPYTELFNDKIVRLRENGILDVILKRYKLYLGSCVKETEAAQLGLQSLRGVFTFLTIGCLSGCFVLHIERKQKQKN